MNEEDSFDVQVLELYEDYKLKRDPLKFEFVQEMIRQEINKNIIQAMSWEKRLHDIGGKYERVIVKN